MNKFWTALVLLTLYPAICTAQAESVGSYKANAQTIELLRLMDKDQNGQVSRKEFMDFMAAEFDRLDVDKNGSLDVGELTALRVSSKRPGGTGSR